MNEPESAGGCRSIIISYLVLWSIQVNGRIIAHLLLYSVLIVSLIAQQLVIRGICSFYYESSPYAQNHRAGDIII